MTAALRTFAPLLALLILTPCIAAAQEGTDARARELYLRGDRLYNEGRYEEAVAAFRESYELSGRALLQFNLANAYERLGRYEEALDALRRYAPHAPVAEEGQIRARIENLSRRAEEQAAAESGPPPPADPADPPPTTPEPAPEPTPSGGGDAALMGAGGALLGLGVVLAAGGAVFGVMALDARDQVDVECAAVGDDYFCTAAAAGALSDDSTYAALADVGVFVGAAVATTGVILLILGATASPAAPGEQARVAPIVGVSPTGGEVGLRGAF